MTETTKTPPQRAKWVNLRDADGNVAARYNPELHLIVIQRRGKTVEYDLRKYTPSCVNRISVLSSK